MSNRIDTQTLRGIGICVSVGEIGQPTLTGEFIEHTADELDRLYFDTARLSREELETALVEAGWECEQDDFDFWHKEYDDAGPSSDIEFVDGSFEDGVQYGDLKIDLRGREIIVPLSAVTRQLLRDCGVING